MFGFARGATETELLAPRARAVDPELLSARAALAQAGAVAGRDEPAHRRSPARPEDGTRRFRRLLAETHIDYDLVETLGGRLPDAAAFDGAIALGGSLNAYDPRLLETRRWIRARVAVPTL